MNSHLCKDIDDLSLFLEKALEYGKQFDFCQLLNTAAPSQHTITPDKYRFILALDIVKEYKPHVAGNAFDTLKKIYDQHEWWFGYLSYDLKNEVEKLSSENKNPLAFPEYHFVHPKVVIYCYYGEREVHLEGMMQVGQLEALFNSINQYPLNKSKKLPRVQFAETDNKSVYLDKITKIQQAIQAGDIYELNYCQEFNTHMSIDTTAVYQQLSKVSPTPFGAFFRSSHHAIMCASPERFLTKRSNTLFSQPIKGTIRRGSTPTLDEAMKKELLSSEKERAENVMIVDLVRNDLSHYAAKGSVKVDELFGIYSFPQVHQMISTVSCTLSEGAHPIDSLRSAFPMGSMTGAPKLKSMALIEKHEEVKRGPYSGAIGYISPNGDFDFNVIIRSLFYNKKTRYLSFYVGGAITILSNPQAEYDECLLKAEAMLKTFAND